VANFGDVVNWVLRLEDRTLAGKTVNLGDGAGWTRFGVTSKNNPQLPPTFWWEALGQARMANDAALEVAKRFYHEKYWMPLHGTQIVTDELAATLMSFAVNDGLSGAVKLLQGILGLTVDGSLGPKTLSELLANDTPETAAKLRDAQESFYELVVARDQSKQRFLDGWRSRAQVVYPDLP